MKICVVGMGYVGLSLSMLLAKKYDVYGVDNSKLKIATLEKGRSPLEDKEITMSLRNKDIKFFPTLDIEKAVNASDYVVICTPTDYDPQTNKLNTKSIYSVARKALALKKDITLIIKSTVNIGFIDEMRNNLGHDNIFFSPEFLREGRALHDNMFPSRIVIGDHSNKAKRFADIVLECSSLDECPILTMGTREAEAVKLFANAYLAMRVSFFNELDSFSLSNGMKAEDIVNGISLDPRIGSGYNNPSFGYGGYCFPKDTKQILANFDGTPQNLFKAIVDSNETRKTYLANKIIELSPKTVGVFRLSMKAGSDNHRSSAVFGITEKLKSRNIDLIFYDDKISEENVEGLKKVSFFGDFVNSSDLIIANRMENELRPYESKVFTRDLFGTDS
jgi:UDPglucose 6-dehydrogenase